MKRSLLWVVLSLTLAGCAVKKAAVTPTYGLAPDRSYATYEEAQRAVDHLADSDFPVRDVTIVGVDLMLVERVIGRLTWGRVLASGAASGAFSFCLQPGAKPMASATAGTVSLAARSARFNRSID